MPISPVMFFFLPSRSTVIFTSCPGSQASIRSARWPKSWTSSPLKEVRTSSSKRPMVSAEEPSTTRPISKPTGGVGDSSEYQPCEGDTPRNARSSVWVSKVWPSSMSKGAKMTVSEKKRMSSLSGNTGGGGGGTSPPLKKMRSAGSYGRLPRVTFSFFFLPSRLTVSLILSPE